MIHFSIQEESSRWFFSWGLAVFY